MLLTDDGLHTWLGRDRDPTEEDLARASAGLHGLGSAGWLCVVEGVYHDPSQEVALMMVRPLHGDADYAAAARAWNLRRRAWIESEA